MSNLTIRVPRLVLATLLLATACGSDDSRTLRIIKGAALKEGVVTGFVIDDETEQPVRAEILVGGTPVRARADGSFEVPATAGRVRVEVRADGYLKTFRDVAVGDRSLPMPFKVARRAPKQVVGPTGGRFVYRDATLEVPAGAFAGDIGVSLTHLSRVRVAAIAATPQFIDDQGIPRRAVALVDLTADDSPGMAVRARVPVPGDATMDTISGYVIDSTGTWSTPIAPDSVAGGYAEFVLTGDLQFGVAVDTRKADGNKIGYLVTERGDTGSGQGDVLDTGELTVSMRAAAIVDPQGSRIELAPGTRARVEVPPEMAVASRAPYAGTVGVTAGRARVVVPPPVADAPKLIKLTMKGNAGQFDVKGTAFSVTTCGVAPNVVDVVEVVEGVVGASAGSEKKDVVAGETATVCTDCSAAAIAECTPLEPDGGAGPVAPDDDGGSPVKGDSATGGGSDGGVTADATAVTADGPTGTTPDAPALQPDAGVSPDAPLAPDMALPADKAPLPPDSAPLPPDSAPLPPDAGVVLEPDAATLPPDAAPPPPDVAPDAAPAVFSVRPTSQDFGSVTIGVTSAAVNFTVTNNGDVPSGTPSASASGDFLITSNGCMNPVGPGTSCLIAVAFKPTAAGARSGMLTVATSVSGGVISLASLTGTGVSPTPAQFALKPLAFDFGWKQEGAATGDVPFTLTNTGGTDSAVPAVSLGGSKDFAFNAAALRTGICASKLAPGMSCTIPVHFIPSRTNTPTITTQRTATLTITGSPGGTVSAALTGDATVDNGLLILPPSHDFMTQPVGQTTAPFTFVVSNPSTTATVTGLTFAVVGNGIYAVINPNPYAGDTSDCVTVKKGQLGPGQSCNVLFTFTPRAAGRVQLMWQATGNIPGTIPITVQATAHLDGTGM